jgi:hypothetical protein
MSIEKVKVVPGKDIGFPSQRKNYATFIDWKNRYFPDVRSIGVHILELNNNNAVLIAKDGSVEVGRIQINDMRSVFKDLIDQAANLEIKWMKLEIRINYEGICRGLVFADVSNPIEVASVQEHLAVMKDIAVVKTFSGYEIGYDDINSNKKEFLKIKQKHFGNEISPIDMIALRCDRQWNMFVIGYNNNKEVNSIELAVSAEYVKTLYGGLLTALENAQKNWAWHDINLCYNGDCTAQVWA